MGSLPTSVMMTSGTLGPEAMPSTAVERVRDRRGRLEDGGAGVLFNRNQNSLHDRHPVSKIPRGSLHPRASYPKYSQIGFSLARSNGLFCSVEPEFAVDGAQVCWSKQGLVGDPHAVERSLKVGAPERQELVELGKAWSQIILLPDELLQDRAVVGHAVENAGRGQAIALQLTSKVARHHRAPPIRAPTLARTFKEQCTRRAICSVGSVSTLRCCLLTNLLRVGARWPNSRREGILQPERSATRFPTLRNQKNSRGGAYAVSSF